MKKTFTKILSFCLSIAMILSVIVIGTVPAVAETPDEVQIEEIDDSTIIENANSLANGVQAYYKDITQQQYVGENQQMRFEYNLREKGNMQVASLKDKEGNSYFENSFDATCILPYSRKLYSKRIC